MKDLDNMSIVVSNKVNMMQIMHKIVTPVRAKYNDTIVL